MPNLSKFRSTVRANHSLVVLNFFDGSFKLNRPHATISRYGTQVRGVHTRESRNGDAPVLADHSF